MPRLRATPAHGTALRESLTEEVFPFSAARCDPRWRRHPPDRGSRTGLVLLLGAASRASRHASPVVKWDRDWKAVRRGEARVARSPARVRARPAVAHRRRAIG